MIEKNIINLIEINDSLQPVELYQRTKLLKFFNFYRVLLKLNNFHWSFFFILQLVFFLQIFFMISMKVQNSSDDSFIILNAMASVFIFHENISDSTTFCMIITTITGIVILLIISVLLNYFSNGENHIKRITGWVINLFSYILIYYLIGPIIYCCLLTFECNQGIHWLTSWECYSDRNHALLVFGAIFNLLLLLIFTFGFSIYSNEIGHLKSNKYRARVNCSYEVVSFFIYVSFFIFSFFYRAQKSIWVLVFFLIYVCLSSVCMCVYVWKHVLFYNKSYQHLIFYGWLGIVWFTIVTLLKILIDFNLVLIFYILGYIFLCVTFYYLDQMRIDNIIIYSNIFHFKSLKEIELFTSTLLSMISNNNEKSRCYLIGIIKTFEENQSVPESTKEKYTKILNNPYLNIKWERNSLSVLGIIYSLYTTYIESSQEFRSDILIIFCYFLINKLKNVSYSAYLLSLFKDNRHMQIYLKYSINENIIDEMLIKIMKSKWDVGIKQVQMATVLLHNLHITNFRNLIYSSITKQIEYLNSLKSRLKIKNNFKNTLNLGQSIIEERIDIERIFNQIIKLNPFNNKIVNEYTSYILNVLQDPYMVQRELRRCSQIKFSVDYEKNSVLYTLFNERSVIFLIDGYKNMGRFLYSTPNFSNLFAYNEKDLINLTVDDLTPLAVRKFHIEIMHNGMKYSNLSSVFNKQRPLYLLDKNGLLHDIRIYIRPLPNFKYGLVHIINVMKVDDTSNMIVLDEDFNINGISFLQNIGVSSFQWQIDTLLMKNIGIILPDFLHYLCYNSNGFYYDIPKDEITKSAILYETVVSNDILYKLEIIIRHIQKFGKVLVTKEIAELEKFISQSCSFHHRIIYTVYTKPLLNGKYKYHKIVIDKDYEYQSTRQSMTREEKRRITDMNLKSKNTSIQIKPLTENITGFNKEVLAHKNIDDSTENLIQKPVINIGNATLFKEEYIKVNKLKKKISKSKQFNTIKKIIYITIFLLLLTTLFIYLAAYFGLQSLTILLDVFKESLFFNHTRTFVTNINIITNNAKYLERKYYNDSYCYRNCSLIYSDLLSEAAGNLIEILSKTSGFNTEIKDQLFEVRSANIKTYSASSDNALEINLYDRINLIINSSLLLKKYLPQILLGGNSTVDLFLVNMENQTNSFRIESINKGIAQEYFLTYLKEGNIYIIIGIQFAFLLTSYLFIFRKTYQVYKLKQKYLIVFFDISKNSLNDFLNNLDMFKNVIYKTTIPEEHDSQLQHKGTEVNDLDEVPKENNEELKESPRKNRSKKQKNSKRKKDKNDNKYIEIFFPNFIKTTVLMSLIFLCLTVYIFLIIIIYNYNSNSLFYYYEQRTKIEENLQQTFDTFNELQMTIITNNHDAILNDNLTTESLHNLFLTLQPLLLINSNQTSIINSIDGDLCSYLFNDNTKENYKTCAALWNSEMTRGIDPSLLKMSLSVISLKHDMQTLLLQQMDPSKIFTLNDNFKSVRTFIVDLLPKLYSRILNETNKAFDNSLLEMRSNFDYVLISYIFVIILTGIGSFVIYTSFGREYKNLLNFLCLIPAEQIIKDRVLSEEMNVLLSSL